MLQTKRSWKGPVASSITGAFAGIAIMGAVYLQHPIPRLPEDTAIKNKLSMAIVTRAKLSYEKLLLLNAETAALNSGAGRAIVHSEGNNPIDPEMLDASITELDRTIASLRIQQRTVHEPDSLFNFNFLFLTYLFALGTILCALTGYFGYRVFHPTPESESPGSTTT